MTCADFGNSGTAASPANFRGRTLLRPLWNTNPSRYDAICRTEAGMRRRQFIDCNFHPILAANRAALRLTNYHAILQSSV
jgi:hypothetical protein